MLVAGLDHVVQLAVGDFHACALRDDHSVVCWGRGAEGELGSGATADAPSFAPVSDP